MSVCDQKKSAVRRVSDEELGLEKFDLETEFQVRVVNRDWQKIVKQKIKKKATAIKVKKKSFKIFCDQKESELLDECKRDLRSSSEDVELMLPMYVFFKNFGQKKIVNVSAKQSYYATTLDSKAEFFKYMNFKRHELIAKRIFSVGNDFAEVKEAFDEIYESYLNWIKDGTFNERRFISSCNRMDLISVSITKFSSELVGDVVKIKDDNSEILSIPRSEACDLAKELVRASVTQRLSDLW